MQRNFLRTDLFVYMIVLQKLRYHVITNFTNFIELFSGGFNFLLLIRWLIFKLSLKLFWVLLNYINSLLDLIICCTLKWVSLHIRRIVGVAHVEDFESINDAARRADCERLALNFAKMLLKERKNFQSISEVVLAIQKSQWCGLLFELRFVSLPNRDL